MNVSLITDIFQCISELPDEDVQNYSDTIDDAKNYIEKKLVTSPVKKDDIKRCEYAAACVAYYDYTVLSLMKEKRGITLTGSATESLNSNQRLESARELRNNALIGISDLTQDMDFIFASVAG